MKTLKHYIFFILTIGLFLVSCQKDLLDQDELSFTQLVSTRGSGPSAAGNGGLILEDQYANFAFHARMKKDGSVSGSFEGHIPGQDIFVHGNIICLIVEGNTAIMSGVITQVSENPYGVEEGDYNWFKVVDNGEGSNADEDLFSDWYWTMDENLDCTDNDVPLFEIVNGNIQVKE